MPHPALTRSLASLFVPGLVGMIIVCGGIILTWKVGDHLLRAEARAGAVHWLDFLQENTSDLEGLLAGRPPGAADRVVLGLARDVGPVFRYGLFDAAGALRFTSSPAGPPVLSAVLPDPGAAPAVALRDGEAPGQPAFFAEVRLPLVHAGDLIGAVRVDVDLTGPATRYWALFGYVSWGLCALLAAAATLPGGMIWRRARDLRRAEARIRHIKHHDPLTGLPDRSLLRERLAAMIAGAAPGLTLICLDLDRFKEINETLGHGAGDQVLQETARRLRTALRPGDLMARLGGDAFAIASSGIDDVDAARRLAGRILERVDCPVEIDLGVMVETGCRLGVACHPMHGSQPDDLFRSACIALHDAKLAGRRIRIFSDDMVRRVALRRSLEADLRRALDQDEFVLHFQPIVGLAGLRLTGFEALLRWQHPDRGLLAPADFLPLAEETCLILPIGERVIGLACRCAAAWPATCRVAVNLSAIQFDGPPLDQVVERHLAASGLPAARLDLEVTETVLIKDSLRTSDVLMGLKEQGVQLSLDDFGTGHASLNYLARYPFDRIKIDQSFVARLGQGPDGLAMVSAVVGLGRRLGLKVTAEGIESFEQLSLLQRERCDEGQGYLFSPPVAADEVPAMIDQIERSSAA